MSKKLGDAISVGIREIPQQLRKGSLSNMFIIMDNLEEDSKSPEDIDKTTDFPVKTDDLFAIHVVHGSLTFVINLVEVEVHANEMLTIMPDCVFEVKYCSSDLKYFCFTLNSELYNVIMQSLGHRPGLTENYSRFYKTIGTKEIFDSIISIYNVIKSELAAPDYPTKKEVIQRYCEIIILKDYYNYLNNTVTTNDFKSRQEHIFHEFLSLLEENYKEGHSISYYANKMCLTPKYLSTVIRSESGKTGLQWIDEYLVFEAKALVRQGRLSIKQISDELNFPTQSMFGRFFKKMTGYSPKQYKQI